MYEERRQSRNSTRMKKKKKAGKAGKDQDVKVEEKGVLFAPIAVAPDLSVWLRQGTGSAFVAFSLATLVQPAVGLGRAGGANRLTTQSFSLSSFFFLLSY